MTDHPGPSGPDDDEQALRVLLERTVPRLPVPATRLDAVRERLARRRRRRAAGGTATAVVLLVAAGALLPDALRTDADRTPPAAPPRAVTEPAGVRAAFPELGGLVLRLPASWDALRLPDGQKLKTLPSGYLAAQPLRSYAQACPDPKKTAAGDGAGVLCEPLERLAPGGLLLTLWGLPGGADLPAAPPAGTPMERVPEVPESCRSMGATAYYTLKRATPDPSTDLYATLCVNGSGADGRAAEVAALLDGATYESASPATEPPTPTARRRGR
ncbi:hypothetical protein ACFWXK_33925 [Streptomyces sp. NPDC059070]|uniref:hypothetical protein n=1 Tax=unclassified Streptomyces TaxID=2593676 RepID=UPI0034E2A5C0